MSLQELTPRKEQQGEVQRKSTPRKVRKVQAVRIPP
ncbi:hypothetical protein IMSAGC002_03833 [Lachnospiraceae bacterium]|nr:hypothetical protein IMSAGC002_03833 [Lachnospiraceae bacterium]